MTQDQIRERYKKELKWFKRHERTITDIGKLIYRARFDVYRLVLKKRMEAGK